MKLMEAEALAFYKYPCYTICLWVTGFKERLSTSITCWVELHL